MPSNRRSLQSQGVPIPEKLSTPRRRVVQKRTPISGEMGGTQTETITYEDRPTTANRRNARSTRSLRSFNPANAGEKATSGVGALEAEFLIAIILLIMLMFANSSASYTERIMSLMKRGSLTCALFFVLALLSTAGPNASRIAKAFGALVIVAILLTAPMTTVITDVDELIKRDWVGSAETGGDVTHSADTGTQQTTTNSLWNDFVKALQQEVNTSGQKGVKNPFSAAGLGQDVQNAFNALISGIIPGGGGILSKLGL